MHSLETPSTTLYFLHPIEAEFLQKERILSGSRLLLELPSVRVGICTSFNDKTRKYSCIPHTVSANESMHTISECNSENILPTWPKQPILLESEKDSKVLKKKGYYYKKMCLISRNIKKGKIIKRKNLLS